MVKNTQLQAKSTACSPPKLSVDVSEYVTLLCWVVEPSFISRTEFVAIFPFSVAFSLLCTKTNVRNTVERLRNQAYKS